MLYAKTNLMRLKKKKKKKKTKTKKKEGLSGGGTVNRCRPMA
jgi:hypothetical protein